MSEIFNNVGRVFKDVARKTAKVSGDAVEMTKTSVNIKLDESKRENFIREIGAVVYDIYKKTPDKVNAEVIDLCKCIDEIERVINEQKSRLAAISNKKYCVGCGVKLDKSFYFCHICGTKQPEIVAEPEDEDDNGEDCACCCDAAEEECGECCDATGEECTECGDSASDEDCVECCGDSCCINTVECCDTENCDCEAEENPETECHCPDCAGTGE